MEETPYGDWISGDDFDKSQAEAEKLKQDCRNYLHEVEQLKAQRDELATHLAGICGAGLSMTNVKLAQEALARIEVKP